MCHVLIIEDEWLIAEQVSDIARGAGATSIDTAQTEEEAVSCARERRPGIIMSDVNLMAGTGPGAVETIHGELGEIPVIFITGTPADCEQCAPPGVVLDKPIDVNRVTEAFRAMAPL